jgi:hypothetical protein
VPAVVTNANALYYFGGQPDGAGSGMDEPFLYLVVAR